MAGMDDWRPFGKHVMRIDGDVLFARTQGEITGDEVITLLQHLRQIEHRYGYVFEVVDASVGGNMSADARRQNAAWHKQNRIHIEVVVFGASLLIRTMVTLLSNAFRLLGSQQITPHFFASEADAWAWVDKRRVELRAKKSSPSATV